MDAKMPWNSCCKKAPISISSSRFERFVRCTGCFADFVFVVLQDGYSALHAACLNNRTLIAEKLILKGADTKALWHVSSWNAIYCAVTYITITRLVKGKTALRLLDNKPERVMLQGIAAKVETVDEDFSLFPVGSLKDCLQYTPEVTVLESLIGPGNCLFQLLPAAAGITRASIEDMVNFHRKAIRALTLKPDIDMELLLIIRLYTVKRPVSFSRYVNTVLNSPARVGLENVAPFMRLLIRALYVMEDAGYGFCGQAYHGVSIGNSAALREQYDNHETLFRPESLITFASFSSATWKSQQIQQFGGAYDSMLFHFLSVRGVDISSVSMFPEEAEILVIPPAVFRVGGSLRVSGNLTVALTHVELAAASYLSRSLPISASAVSKQVVSEVVCIKGFSCYV
jgi:hypothetical protein